MPIPEALGACLLYYFSVLNVETEIQAVHWLVVFPLAGLLWSGILAWTAPLLGGRRNVKKYFQLWMAVAALPLVLPLPYLTWYAGAVEGQFVPARMLAVALRRGWRFAPEWLSPLFLLLALVAFGIQWWVYRKMLGVPRRRALAHFVGAAAIYFTAVTALALAAAIPLRTWLE